MSENYFVEGIPLEVRHKIHIMGFLFGLALVNQTLPIFSSVFEYPYRGLVTLLCLGGIVIFSIGQKSLEGLVMGAAVFVLLSAFWDFTVLDVSDLRRRILVGAVLVLVFESFFGKLSFANALKYLRMQLGSK